MKLKITFNFRSGTVNRAPERVKRRERLSGAIAAGRAQNGRPERTPRTGCQTYRADSPWHFPQWP